jgi:hypothetical protein
MTLVVCLLTLHYAELRHEQTQGCRYQLWRALTPPTTAPPSQGASTPFTGAALLAWD